jgi:hypothetical protein
MVSFSSPSAFTSHPVGSVPPNAGRLRVLHQALPVSSLAPSLPLTHPRCSLAEARHRAELKRNADYQYFMLQMGQDPRVRKHDLATFLNRPVSRLPRTSLLLEHLLKLSDAGTDDTETLPLALAVLADVLRATQPGIDAAGSRAKFWEVAETLVFSRGEIIVRGPSCPAAGSL